MKNPHRHWQRTFARVQIGVIVAFLLPAQIAMANTTISACGETLSTPSEVYELDQDISIDSADCLTVTADNVTIDGMGLYSITVTTSGMAINAPAIAAGWNVTVKDITIMLDGFTGTAISTRADRTTNLDGGSISIDSATITGNIYSSGVSDAIGYESYSGNAGAISVTDSSITGDIHAHPEDANLHSFSGNGGNVTITSSTVGAIIAMSGTVGSADGGADSGDAGAVIISSSTVGTVNASAPDGQHEGGNGGNISVSNSTTGDLTTNGGGSLQNSNILGTAGLVTLVDSDVEDINANGGFNTNLSNQGIGTQMVIDTLSTFSSTSCTGNPGCLPPVITPFSPADDATNVAVTADLSLTLNEDVTLVNGAVFSLYHALDDTLVEQFTIPDAAVTQDNATTFTIDRSVVLIDGREYYVQITAGAFKDSMRATSAAMNNETSWSFTTILDVIAPVLSSITAVAGGTTITLTYDELLNTGSVPAAGDFAVTSDGDALTVDSVQVTGSTVVLTLSAAILTGEDIMLSYTAGADPIEDASTSNNVAAAIADQPILPGDTPDLIATDSGRSATDNITTDLTPQITATCMGLDDTHTVQWYLNGVASGVPVTCSSDSTTFAAGVSGLAAGSYAVRHAVSKDGVFSARGPTLTLVIDTTAPGAPGTAPDLAAGSDSGVNTDNITNDTTPTFAGDCDNDDDVQLFIGGVSTGSADTCTNGADTYSVTAGSIATDGAKSFTVKFTDTAGNVSNASAALSVTIDTVTDTPAITSPADDTTTGSSTPTFSGTTEANAVVTVKEGSNTLCTDSTTSGGTWSCISSVLVSGDYSIVASAVDVAGNAAALSTAIDITVDLDAPAAPGTPDLVAGSDTGINSDNITADTTPSMTVTCEIGSTIKLFEDSDTVTPVYSDDCDDGTEDITLSLSDGSYIYYASQTDDGDNDSADSSTLALTIDSSASAPGISAPSASATVSPADTLTVSGSCETNATVYVANANIVGSPVNDTCTAGTYSIDVTWTPGTLGSNTISVTQIDVAGTASAAGTVNVIVDDGTLPASSSSSSTATTTNGSNAPSGGGRGAGTALREALMKSMIEDGRFHGAASSAASTVPVASQNRATVCPDERPIPQKKITVGPEFYADVSASAWYAGLVQQATEAGYVTGYVDEQGIPLREFRPEEAITAAEAVRMVLTARGDAVVNGDPRTWVRAWIRLAQEKGLPLHHRSPNTLLTRGEAVRLILGSLCLDPTMHHDAFVDISPTHPYAGDIARAAGAGIVLGDAGDRRIFRPDDHIARAELAAMLMRAIAQ